MKPTEIVGKVGLIDVEASGLMPGSFPVEVSLKTAVAEQCILVRPDPSWDRSLWDPVAERMHGLSLTELARKGRGATAVAAAVNDALGGRIVFSDAPTHDIGWLDMLHAAAGLPRRYKIYSIGRLMDHLGYGEDGAQAGFDRAYATHPPSGRARLGVAFLDAVLRDAVNSRPRR